MRKRESIKEFERAEYARLLANCGTFPRSAVVKPSYSDNTANGLTRLILAYCRAKGWHAERINTTGRPIDRRRTVTDITGARRTIGSIQYIPTAGTRGSADIHILAAGLALFVEVKAGRDRQREAQREYQRQVEQAGGVYIITHNFDDFCEQVAEATRPR